MTGILFDTHLLLWVVTNSPFLPVSIRQMLLAGNDRIFFGPASLQEVAIKYALGRPDFQIDPGRLYAALLQDGFLELPVRGSHAIAVADLPPVQLSPDGHKDPFDRLLIAQAAAEGFQLATSDRLVARYGGNIRLHPKNTVPATS